MSARLRAARSLPALLAVGALAACATTGATFRSGVGDAFLERPPYYAGRAVRADTLRVAHLPVAHQRGAAQAPIFEPEGGADTPIAALLAEMNAYLDSLGVTTRIAAPAGTPPDVHFGCETDPAGDCLDPDDDMAPQAEPRLRLAVGRPSPAWVAAVGAALDSAGAGRTLVLTLEVGQYRVTATGWRNDKSVELGTGHSQKLPWLTPLDMPVQVLQLTGALVDRDGQAVRIGAEGLLARRTGLVASGFGAQAPLRDEDVEQLRTLRRDDLPGRPLVWQVALRTLVAQLTRSAALAAQSAP